MVVLISTIYDFNAVVAGITRFNPGVLYLIVDESPDSIQKDAIEMILNTFGKVLDIKQVKTKVYDIVEVAGEVVRLIDAVPSKYEIFVNISCGRKTQALGLLFGAYARAERVKTICYFVEEDKKMIVIPKCSYNLNNSENQLLLELSKSPSLSLTEISEKTSLSKAIIYRNLRELKTKSLIVDFEKGFALTDFGKIAIL